MFRGFSVTQQCRGMSYNMLKTMNKVSTKESVIAFYTLNRDHLHYMHDDGSPDDSVA